MNKKTTEAKGKAIAEQLGNEVSYNGPQYEGDRFCFHLFTDRVTGTTFSAETVEEAKARLVEVRKNFGASPPAFEARAHVIRWHGDKPIYSW